jgi:hypothetical protein
MRAVSLEYAEFCPPREDIQPVVSDHLSLGSMLTFSIAILEYKSVCANRLMLPRNIQTRD